MDWNLAGSAGAGQIVIRLWPFCFERSRSNDRLLLNGTFGKFLFGQHMQPIGHIADQCILTVVESSIHLTCVFIQFFWRLDRVIRAQLYIDLYLRIF